MNEIETTIIEETETNSLSHLIQNAELITPEKRKRELPKTSSIGSMFKEIHKEVVSVIEENKVELTEDNVLFIWENFLTDNKTKLQNAFLSAAQNQVPKLIEDKVTFTASNNVSLEMLQLHKMDITTYFRKKNNLTNCGS